MYTDYIAILFEKGLYAQAKKTLSKSKETAKENELYLALDNLAICEYRIAEKESNKEDIKQYIEETYPSSCQIEYHCIWGHYHYANGNKFETYHYRKKVLELIPFKPFVIKNG